MNKPEVIDKLFHDCNIDYNLLKQGEVIGKPHRRSKIFSY